MIYNIHPVTGIAFGVMNANNIDGDVLNAISFDHGIDAENIERLAQFATNLGDFVLPDLIDNETAYQYYQRLESACMLHINKHCEESEEVAESFEEFSEEDYTGTIWHSDYQGVTTKYDTDSNIVTVLQSPHTALVAQCSPCYPNAGDLDTMDSNGIQAYTVPDDWKYKY